VTDLPDDHDDAFDERPGGEPEGTSVGEVLGYAWRKFTQNLGQWLVIWLIGLALGIGVIAVQGVITSATSETVDSVDGGSTTTTVGATGVITSWIAAALLWVLLGVLLVAVARAAVAAVEGRPVAVGEAFRLSSANVAAGAVFGLIYGVVSPVPFVGILLGIGVFVLLGFTLVLSALDGRGPDAFRDSVQLVRAHPRTSVPFWVIGWFLTGCLCIVGAPITMLGAAYLVKRYRGEDVVP
jgi:hypothetical protein